MKIGISRAVAGGAAAIVGSIAGLVGLGFLIAALAAPTPSPTTLRRYTELFRWQDAGVLVQALAMIVVVPSLRGPGARTGLRWPGSLEMLGLFAQGSVVAVLILRFANITSDMLYMLPQGLIGIWILAVNRSSPPFFGKTLVRTGWVAGAGLLVVGLGFLIYAAFVAPQVFSRPLSAAETDAQSWTVPNIAAHVCLAVGTLLGRATYPVWTALLGVSLLTLGRRDKASHGEIRRR